MRSLFQAVIRHCLGLDNRHLRFLHFGSSDRPYVNGGVVTQEKTSTSGMLVDLLLPLSYQFSENIQMRTGITIQSVFGWEEIDSQQRSLQFQNYYIGFPFDFYYTF